MGRLTVTDLLDARSTQRFAMLHVETLQKADAAARAGVELLSVPHEISNDIAEPTNQFLIAMGAGSAGPVRYLFRDDVLGQNRGHSPRHARVYAVLAAAQDRHR